MQPNNKMFYNSRNGYYWRINTALGFESTQVYVSELFSLSLGKKKPGETWRQEKP